MNQLAHFDRAKQELALATRIDEVKEIRDRAEALRVYAKQAGEGLIMQNQCAEIKIRAERRAGELLKEIPREQGRRADLTSVQLGTKLQSVGISKTQAHRWQTMALVPEEEFENYLEKARHSGTRELTSSRIHFLGHLQRNEQERKEKQEQWQRECRKISPKMRWYMKHPRGFKVTFSVIGEMGGLPVFYCECDDPEYLKMSEEEKSSCWHGGPRPGWAAWGVQYDPPGWEQAKLSIQQNRQPKHS